LRSIKIIDQFNPDNIIISTPATTGLFALLAGKLMNIKTTGIYHTDFKSQSLHITGDEGLANTVESYINWFYSQLDEIRVPTNEYINLLMKRGFNRGQVKLFRRGIDIDQFSPEKEDRSLITNKYNVPAGINLVYTGRVSKDKNLDFLVEVYQELIHNFDNLNLMIIGDGPYYQELSRKTEEYDRIFLIGRLDRSALPEIYASSDLLLFPSTTDTFGMTVLEAQACGLPALVSNVGGPQEIVDDEKTGFILEVDSTQPWTDTISKLIIEIKNNTEYFRQLRINSRNIVGSSYDWQEVLKDLLLEQNEMEQKEPELLKSPLVKKSVQINS
jgi:glycosyltransferase involved in cell wall biosynthesis